MSGNITVSSTTDSQAEVEKAADYGEQQTLPLTEEEKPESPVSEVEETETAAAPEPAEVSQSEEEEEEEEQEETRPATNRDKRKALVAQVQRQASQIAALESELRKFTQPAQPAPPAAAKPDYSRRPDASDAKYRGKSYEDVMEDMVHHVQQKDAQQKAEEERADAERQQQERAQKIFQAYDQQVQQVRGKYKDFVDVVGPLNNDLPTAAKLAIVQMPNGAEVAYYVGKHPEIGEQLTAWDNPDVHDGFNRIVATLQNIGDELALPAPSSSSSSPRSGQPRPAAPRPLRHVGGGTSVTGSSVDPGTMEYQDFKRWRNSGGGR